MSPGPVNVIIRLINVWSESDPINGIYSDYVIRNKRLLQNDHIKQLNNDLRLLSCKLVSTDKHKDIQHR